MNWVCFSYLSIHILVNQRYEKIQNNLNELVTDKYGKSKELLKIINLLIIFILSLLIISAKLYAQEICDLSAHPFFPPTPYVNAFLKFDGQGDYVKTNDIPALEFDTATTSGFVIEARIKIGRVFQPQYILGKHYGAGWLLAYHTAESGYISISFSTGWKRVYNLGSDTSWHDYRITYDKNSATLQTYVDGNLTNTYTNFVYGNIANEGAFSIGNVGFFPNYGPGSINLNSMWFKGSVDYVKITSGPAIIVNYDFNENSGQFAKDSASYYISDRTLPGENYCGSRHMMLGFYPCQDSCDPEWILDDIDKPTNYSSLAGGMKNVRYEGNAQIITPSYSTGMTSWNGYIVNCGNFNLAGQTPVGNIAKWDGFQWSSIGGGFNYEPNDVAVYNNELYATGFFDTAIGYGPRNFIAKWNGTQWEDLGRGLENVGNVMTVYNNELIVGGFFMGAGEVYAPRIAKWNGAEWSSMGFGMTGAVYALKIYNGQLYAGGKFIYAGTSSCNGIAKWNGSNWEPVGTGVVGGEMTVKTLDVYNGELVAAGSFTYMNGVHCSNIASYDGSAWRGLDDGAKGYSCLISLAYIYDLEVLNNELYAVGLFTKIGTISANKIAKWNGTRWCSVEYGIELLPRSLEAYNGSMYINGDFYSVSGKEYGNIVKYTPREFTGTGNSNQLPADFQLWQNYPNPFNPVTKIEYSVKSSAVIRLVVYDIGGRETAVLVNGVQNAGTHQTEFNASALSSGVYFYSLFAEGKKIETKKMLLIK